jgi:hypothetical protein
MPRLSFTFNGATKPAPFETEGAMTRDQVNALENFLRAAFKLPSSSEVRLANDITGPFALTVLPEKLARHSGLKTFLVVQDNFVVAKDKAELCGREAHAEKSCNDLRAPLINFLASQNVTARYVYFKRESKVLFRDSFKEGIEIDNFFKKTEHDLIDDQPFAIGLDWAVLIIIFINDDIHPLLVNLADSTPERLKHRLLKIIDKIVSKSSNRLVLQQSLETEAAQTSREYCLEFLESQYDKYFDEQEQKLLRRFMKHSPVEMHEYIVKLKNSNQLRLCGKLFLFVIKQSRIRLPHTLKTVTDRDPSPRHKHYSAKKVLQTNRVDNDDHKNKLISGLTNLLSSESVTPQGAMQPRNVETLSQSPLADDQFMKKNTFPLINNKITDLNADEKKGTSQTNGPLLPTTPSLISQKLEAFPPHHLTGMPHGNELTTPHFSPVVPEFQARLESMCQKNKGQTPPVGSHHKNEFFITFNSGEDISKDGGNLQNSKNHDSSFNIATQIEKPSLGFINTKNVLTSFPNKRTSLPNNTGNPIAQPNKRRFTNEPQDEISRILNETATINSRPKGAIKIRYPVNVNDKPEKSAVKNVSSKKENSSFDKNDTIGQSHLEEEHKNAIPITVTSPSPLSSNAEALDLQAHVIPPKEDKTTLSPPAKANPSKATPGIKGIPISHSQMTPPPLPKATSIIPGSSQTISYEHIPNKGQYTDSIVGRNNSMLTEKKHPIDHSSAIPEHRVKYLTNAPPGRDNSEISKINMSNINGSHDYSENNSVLYRPVQDKSGKRNRLILQTDRESLNNSYNLKLFAVSHRSIFLSNNQDFHNENLNKFYKNQYENFISGKYQGQRKNSKETLRRYLKQNQSSNISPCRSPSGIIDKDQSSLQNKNQSLRAIDSRGLPMFGDNSGARKATEYSELDFQLKPTKVEPNTRIRMTNQSERTLIRDPSSSPFKDISCNSRINNSDYIHLNDDSRTGSTHDKALEQNFIKLCEHEVYEINDLGMAPVGHPSSDEAPDFKINLAKNIPLQSINEVLETDLYEEQRLYMSFENILSFMIHMNLFKSTLDTKYFKDMFQVNDPIIKSVISVFEKSRMLKRKLRRSARKSEHDNQCERQSRRGLRAHELRLPNANRVPEANPHFLQGLPAADSQTADQVNDHQRRRLLNANVHPAQNDDDKLPRVPF